MGLLHKIPRDVDSIARAASTASFQRAASSSLSVRSGGPGVSNFVLCHLFDDILPCSKIIPMAVALV